MTTIIADPYIRNLLKYVGTILVGALAAGLGVLMVQLAGTDPIVWRPVFAAALGPIVTGLMARQLTKAGREDIGNLVTHIGVGPAKAALEVEAARQVAAAPVANMDDTLDPDETDQLLTLIHAVGPQRSIRALNDEQYRDPHREDAP
jgi:hypothetical protein